MMTYGNDNPAGCAGNPSGGNQLAFAYRKSECLRALQTAPPLAAAVNPLRGGTEIMAAFAK